MPVSTYFKVVCVGQSKVVVRQTDRRTLDRQDAAVFPQTLFENQNGRKYAEYFAQALRGPLPMVGSLEWEDMCKLAGLAVDVAPQILDKYCLDRSLAPDRTAVGIVPSARRARRPSADACAKEETPRDRADRLREDIEQLGAQSTLHLQRRMDELVQQLGRLAHALGLRPSSTPSEIVDTALAKLSTPSTEDQMKRVRWAVRRPADGPPKEQR